MKLETLHKISLCTVIALLAVVSLSCTKAGAPEPTVTIRTVQEDDGRENVKFFFSKTTTEETTLTIDVYCEEGVQVIFEPKVTVPAGYTSARLNLNLPDQFDPGLYHVAFRIVAVTGGYKIGEPSSATVRILNTW